jgi:hypothetical protein
MSDAPSRARAASLAAVISALALVAAADARGQVITPPNGGRTARAPRVGTPRRAMPRGYARQAVPYGNRGAAAYQNNGTVLANLRATLALLARADHDYQGHRVRAMHHVGTAIRALEPAMARRTQPNPALATTRAGNGAVAGRGRMPQATSDGHLRNALQSLNAIDAHLATTGGASRHVRARASVQNAMREIHVALNIR